MRRKNKKRTKDSGVAWQNKDITSKILAEEFGGKSFSVYGIDIPDIESAEPTDLPAIEANELRMDNMLILKDSSVAIVDYESQYKPENKKKYLGYAARVTDRIFDRYRDYRPLRIIVIYTADVKRGQTDPVLDMGNLKLIITEAFLSDFKSDELLEEIKAGLEEENIADEILMKLIIFPLTYRGDEDKRKAVTTAIQLAEKINDRKKQVFALTGIYTFCDKVITEKDAERIRRIINMTKVEMIYTREREEAVEKAVKETRKEDRKEARREKNDSAIALLKEGDSIEKVARCLKMPESKVRKLAESITVSVSE